MSSPPPPPSYSGAPDRFGRPPARLDTPGGAPPGPPGGAPPRKRGPWFWAGLGVLGCLVLPAGCLALFGALAGGVFYATKAPADATHALLADIRAGELDAAYARFSPDAQRQLSREAFGEYVLSRPGLRDHRGATLDSRNIRNERARMRGYVEDAAGERHPIEVELSRHGGEWRVDTLRFGGDVRPDFGS